MEKGKAYEGWGTNAPPTSSTKLRNCEFDRVFVAWMWPDGHIWRAWLHDLLSSPFIQMVFQFGLWI